MSKWITVTGLHKSYKITIRVSEIVAFGTLVKLDNTIGSWIDIGEMSGDGHVHCVELPEQVLMLIRAVENE